jgi:hypothetical protein
MQSKSFGKVTLLVIACLLFANLWMTLQRPAEAAPSGQVQYKVVKFFYQGRTLSAMQTELNGYERNGWRLVSNDMALNDMDQKGPYQVLIFMK